MMDDVRTDRETKMTQKDTDKCASRDKAAAPPDKRVFFMILFI
jgi:hypothetical protein